MAEKQRSGEAIYREAHDRVRALYGRADGHDCVICGLRAKDWALKRPEDCIGNLSVVRVRNSARWISDCPQDYVPLDRACHRFEDARRRREMKAYL